MTGYSWSKKYWKKMISGVLLVSGSFLLLEHLFSFGGFDIELLGHEYLGLGMILLAFLISIKWKQIKDIHTWKDLWDEGERE